METRLVACPMNAPEEQKEPAEDGAEDEDQAVPGVAPHQTGKHPDHGEGHDHVEHLPELLGLRAGEDPPGHPDWMLSEVADDEAPLDRLQDPENRDHEEKYTDRPRALGHSPARTSKNSVLMRSSMTVGSCVTGNDQRGRPRHDDAQRLPV
jgi:hypothetical protein